MRRHDWPERLADAIRDRSTMPFDWGTNDCAMWSADAVLAMTDVDHAEGIRGSYTNASGAVRFLKKLGGYRSLLPTMFQEVPVAFAQRGDVVLAKFEGRDTLGICVGATALFVASEGGLTPKLLADCDLAWRVD